MLIPHSPTHSLASAFQVPLYTAYDIPCKSPDYEMTVSTHTLMAQLNLKGMVSTNAGLEFDDYRWGVFENTVLKLEGSLNPVHDFQNVSLDFMPVAHIPNDLLYFVPIARRLIAIVCEGKCTLKDCLIDCYLNLQEAEYKAVCNVIIANYLTVNALKRDAAEDL